MRTTTMTTPTASNHRLDCPERHNAPGNNNAPGGNGAAGSNDATGGRAESFGFNREHPMLHASTSAPHDTADSLPDGAASSGSHHQQSVPSGAPASGGPQLHVQQNTTAPDTAGETMRKFVFDRLVLASASPRRRLLLEQIGLGGFAVEVADVEEHEDPHSCPREMVRHNACIKAEAVSRRLPHALVLGADTTVALADEVLNKPADMGEARAMLRKLSGRTHTVYTGVCLISPADDLYEVHHVTSAVTFRPLDEDAIDAYFQLVNPLDKAGAYGIQEGKELIIARLEGSLENVMGLPVQFLEQRWRELGCLPRLHQLHPRNAGA